MMFLRELNQERDEKIRERTLRLVAEQQPLVEELKENGFEIKSVWDLVNSRSNYPAAIPILLKHLQMPYADRTRGGIARALAVRDPQTREAWPLLVEVYRKTPAVLGPDEEPKKPSRRSLAKDGLACALSVIASRETLEELIALAKEPEHGNSRIFFIRTFKRSKSPVAKAVLAELDSDPVFQKEIRAKRSDR